ncbi:ATP-binding protein [[Clostridium] symbiosum]|uniref:ATP-binding protein n=1 Tax=Clostridium symbiosum TaxID=1512 RepID=UPI001D0779ED|nr:AAA family ATPase [[Clostridium] symbiosum]MCB6610584.1 AAA family ATPase [[Clostridium] symbiosum]
MNIKRAKQEIKNCIEAYLMKDGRGEYLLPAVRQRPVLLMGPPGIGKTQIMEQIARECQVGLVSYTITHHTRQSAIGLPYIVEKEYDGKPCSVTEYTMSEIVASIYDRMEETGLKEGILFIDEINCVSETLAPMMLQFLQCKTFGNHRIPEGWIIVTAGNPPEYNKSVREFDIATLDRIKKIDVEADYKVWKEYAVMTDIHPAVTAYLEARPEHFYRIETTVDGKRFATPRGWEDLARFLEIYEKLGKTVDRDVIYQYIEHPGIAKDFANYLELYSKYKTDYQIERILSGEPDTEMARRVAAAPFDERFSVVSLVLSHLNGKFRDIYLKGRYLELLREKLGMFRQMADEMPVTEAGTKTVEAKTVEAKTVEAKTVEAKTVEAKTVETKTTESAAGLLENLAAEMVIDLEKRHKAGLISRREEHLNRDAADKLQDYALTLEKEHIVSPEAGFAKVRELFREEAREYDTMSETALTMLEHGFDFMEAAFAAGQEMVIFVTELNTNYYSVNFLRENRCERYYEYNKNLLFEDRESDIRKRLAQRT